TRSLAKRTCSAPPRSEACSASSSVAPSRCCHQVASVQCAEPVTGSSGMPTAGAKTRLTMALSRSPRAVTITARTGSSASAVKSGRTPRTSSAESSSASRSVRPRHTWRMVTPGRPAVSSEGASAGVVGSAGKSSSIIPSARAVQVRIPLRVVNRWLPPSTCAAARVACPHRSTSVVGVNQRSGLGSVPATEVSTKAVSECLSSAATDCIHSGSAGASSSTTPAGLPWNGASVKASTTYARTAALYRGGHPVLSGAAEHRCPMRTIVRRGRSSRAAGRGGRTSAAGGRGRPAPGVESKPDCCGRWWRTGSGQGNAAFAQPRQRVDLLAAGVPDLEVQVGSGGETAVSHGGDLVARFHGSALVDEDGVDVAVDADRAVFVLHPHPQAETAGRSGLDHHPVGDRVDRRALGVGDVDSVVDGSPAAAEAGGEVALGRFDELRPHGLGQGGRALFGDAGALGELLRLFAGVGDLGHRQHFGGGCLGFGVGLVGFGGGTAEGRAGVPRVEVVVVGGGVPFAGRQGLAGRREGTGRNGGHGHSATPRRRGHPGFLRLLGSLRGIRGRLFAAGGAVSSQCLPFRLGESDHAPGRGPAAGRGTGQIVIRP